MKDKTYVKDYEQVFSIRGEDILVVAPARFDSITNEMLYDGELDDSAIEKAHNIYRENNGYLTPHLIREMRDEIGISQRDFATLMGWSQTTIVMYESGSLPTNNNNNQLKMIHDNPYELQQYFTNAKGSLSAKACSKITNYLLELRKTDVDDGISVLDVVDWFRIVNVKQMKMFEIVEPLTQLKVMKLLYYAQGIMMSKFKRKLFCDDILAWDYGPIVRVVYEKYQGRRSIVSDLIDGDLPQELINNYEKINKNQRILEVLNLVQENLSHLSAISLMRKTHRERPWLSTKKNDVICDSLIQQFFEENLFDILNTVGDENSNI